MGGTVGTKISQSFGVYEPELTTTFLPRCPGCGSPHPRAVKLDTDVCPGCGTTCPLGATRTVKAAITGWSPWAIAARLFLWLGQCLARLARSI